MKFGIMWRWYEIFKLSISIAENRAEPMYVWLSGFNIICKCKCSCSVSCISWTNPVHHENEKLCLHRIMMHMTSHVPYITVGYQSISGLPGNTHLEIMRFGRFSWCRDLWIHVLCSDTHKYTYMSFTKRSISHASLSIEKQSLTQWKLWFGIDEEPYRKNDKSSEIVWLVGFHINASDQIKMSRHFLNGYNGTK